MEEDFDIQFAKEMRRERTIQVIVLIVLFGYFYLTTKDSDVGNAKLMWAIIISNVIVIYRIEKLQDLVFKLHR